jgi:glucokinase
VTDKPPVTTKTEASTSRTKATSTSAAGSGSRSDGITVGIDLGGTKVYAVATQAGQVLGEAKEKTPVHGGPLGVVDVLAAVVRQLAPEGVESVGVGAPGAIDHTTGVIRWAPNLPGWIEPFGLADALSEATGGSRVLVDNDVNVGTLAEYQLGAGQGQDNLLGIFVGTGVGGGLILDGALRRGPTGFAGEIGHMVVRPGGRRCGCGGRGHVEAYAGRSGMERRARQLADRGSDTVLVSLAKARRMTSSVFARALAAKDTVAINLIETAVQVLAQALAASVTMLDVPLVVIGGGLADRLAPSFVARIQAATAELVPAAQAGDLSIVSGLLGDRGGALGAALLAGASIRPDAALAPVPGG